MVCLSTLLSVNRCATAEAAAGSYLSPWNSAQAGSQVALSSACRMKLNQEAVVVTAESGLQPQVTA